MEDVESAVREASAQLGALVPVALAGHGARELSDDALLGLVSDAAALIRQVEALVCEGAAEVQTRCAAPDRSLRLNSRMGARNAGELLQRATRGSAATVNRWLRAGSTVRPEVSLTSGELLPGPLPAMRQCLLTGVVGTDGLLAIATPLLAARPRADAQVFALADDTLAQAAGGDHGPIPTAEDLRVLAGGWAMAMDQEGAEPREQRAIRRRFLRLGTAVDGLVPITGQLLPEVAAQLQRLLDAITNPRVQPPPRPETEHACTVEPSAAPSTLERADGVGTTAHEQTAAHDGAATVASAFAELRTLGQLQHDALMSVLTISAKHADTPQLGGAAPTLVVTATATDLAAGTGWARLDGCAEPVSTGLARQIACCGATIRVTQDSFGRIVALHSTDRIFTATQRKAILTRDGGCVIPGCRAPAAWCEIHHVHEHARGGPTHTDNGVALCWFHHRTLDTLIWQVRMNHGVPEIRGPSWWDPHQRWHPARAPGPPARITRAA